MDFEKDIKEEQILTSEVSKEDKNSLQKLQEGVDPEVVNDMI